MASMLSDALEIVVRTDPGMIRELNEDSVFADTGRGLVILADGMGGYNAGEVASGMATSFLASALETSFFDSTMPGVNGSGGASAAHGCLLESITRANTAIFNAALSEPHLSGMGTTLVTALFHDNRMTVAHIGDSRLYLLRDEILSSVTRDHSLLQEQLDEGLISPEAARHAEHRNLVTRALGVESDVLVDTATHPLEPDDIVLLCSDGLNDMLEDQEIGELLGQDKFSLARRAEHLVERANEYGGRDNVSVILLRLDAHSAAQPAAKRWWHGFLNQAK